MTPPHINQKATRSQPRQAAVGQLAGDATIDSVTDALTAIGVDTDRIYFLVGSEGADVLDSTPGIFKVFDDVIDKPLTALREGHTIVGVFGTDADNAVAVRQALASAGVVNNHYFGQWTHN